MKAQGIEVCLFLQRDAQFPPIGMGDPFQRFYRRVRFPGVLKALECLIRQTELPGYVRLTLPSTELAEPK